MLCQGFNFVARISHIHSTFDVKHIFFQSNLQGLMDGLRSFISEQNRANLEAALTRLKEDLMLDASKINQLSTALWIFQVGIMMILITCN